MALPAMLAPRLGLTPRSRAAPRSAIAWYAMQQRSWLTNPQGGVDPLSWTLMFPGFGGVREFAPAAAFSTGTDDYGDTHDFA